MMGPAYYAGDQSQSERQAQVWEFELRSIFTVISHSCKYDSTASSACARVCACMSDELPDSAIGAEHTPSP